MLQFLLLAAVIGDGDTATAPVDYLQVVARGLKYLDAGGAELEKGSSCINCHHAPLRNLALVQGMRVGVTVDAAALTEAIATQTKRVMELKFDYRDKQWGHSLSAFYLMTAPGGHQPLPDGVAKDLIQIIVAEQQPDGSWQAAQQFGNQRRPARDANEAQTLWSLLALSQVEATEEVTQSKRKGLAWLAKTDPGTTVDVRVLRLMLELQLGNVERANLFADKLLKTQHADGGWGWQPDDPSDAWATGLALRAVSSIPDKAGSAIEAGRAFLAKTQTEDGSWLVEGKLTKSPRMSSYFGTAWAAIGISSTLPAAPK